MEPMRQIGINWRKGFSSGFGRLGLGLDLNLKKVWDKTTPEVVGWLSQMNMTADILTLGCLYPTDGTMHMSMYGSATDGQVFSRTLEDDEMEDITSCN